MKKVNRSLTRKIILDTCLSTFLSCEIYSIVLFIVAAHDKDDGVRIFAWVLMGGVLVSLVCACAISIIDFICHHKKSKKLKFVQPQIVIKEDIVV